MAFYDGPDEKVVEILTQVKTLLKELGTVGEESAVSLLDVSDSIAEIAKSAKDMGKSDLAKDLESLAKSMKDLKNADPKNISKLFNAFNQINGSALAKFNQLSSSADKFGKFVNSYKKLNDELGKVSNVKDLGKTFAEIGKIDTRSFVEFSKQIGGVAPSEFDGLSKFIKLMPALNDVASKDITNNLNTFFSSLKELDSTGAMRLNEVFKDMEGLRNFATTFNRLSASFKNNSDVNVGEQIVKFLDDLGDVDTSGLEDLNYSLNDTEGLNQFIITYGRLVKTLQKGGDFDVSDKLTKFFDSFNKVDMTGFNEFTKKFDGMDPDVLKILANATTNKEIKLPGSSSGNSKGGFFGSKLGGAANKLLSGTPLAGLGNFLGAASGVAAVAIALHKVSSATLEAVQHNTEYIRALGQCGVSLNNAQKSTLALSVKMQQLGNQWENLWIDIGTALEPVVEIVTDFLSSILDAFGASKEVPDYRRQAVIAQSANRAKATGMSYSTGEAMGSGIYGMAGALYGTDATAGMTQDQIANMISGAVFSGGGAEEIGVNVSDNILTGYLWEKGIDIVNVEITDAMKDMYRFQLAQEEVAANGSDAMQANIKRWTELGFTIDKTKGKLFGFDEVIQLAAIDSTIPDKVGENLFGDGNGTGTGGNSSKKRPYLTPDAKTNKESAEKNKDAADKNKEAADKNKDNADEQNDAADKQEDAADEQSNAAEEQKDAADKQKDASSEQSNAGDKQKDAASTQDDAATKNVKAADDNVKSTNKLLDDKTGVGAQIKNGGDELGKNIKDSAKDAADTLGKGINDGADTADETLGKGITDGADIADDMLKQGIIDGGKEAAKIIKNAIEGTNVNVKVTNETVIRYEDKTNSNNNNETTTEEENTTNNGTKKLDELLRDEQLEMEGYYGRNAAPTDGTVSIEESYDATHNDLSDSEFEEKYGRTREEAQKYYEEVRDYEKMSDADYKSKWGRTKEEAEQQFTSKAKNRATAEQQAQEKKQAESKVNNFLDKLSNLKDNAGKAVSNKIVGGLKNSLFDVTEMADFITAMEEEGVDVSDVGTWLPKFMEFALVSNLEFKGSTLLNNLKGGEDSKLLTDDSLLSRLGTTGMNYYLARVFEDLGDDAAALYQFSNFSNWIQDLLGVKDIFDEHTNAQFKGISDFMDMLTGSAMKGEFVSNAFELLGVDMGQNYSWLDRQQLMWDSGVYSLLWGTDAEKRLESVGKVNVVQRMNDKGQLVDILEYNDLYWRQAAYEFPLKVQALYEAGRLDRKTIEDDPRVDFDSKGNVVLNNKWWNENGYYPDNQAMDADERAQRFDTNWLIENGYMPSDWATRKEFANGGIGTKEIHGASLFEGNKAEAVIPLESEAGIRYLSDAMREASAGEGMGNQIVVNLTLRGLNLSDNESDWQYVGKKIAEVIDVNLMRRGELNYGSSF